MRKKNRRNAEMQPQVDAAAQIIADKTSARSEQGSVRVGKGSENRRKTEIKFVDSVLNVTNIDSSNKECGKVVASPLADIMAKKNIEKKNSRCSVLSFTCIVAGVVATLCLVLNMTRSTKVTELKK